MIYIVECGFSDPAREAAWNDYYSGPKLAQVLAVPGFRTSQRFKAMSAMTTPYFAMHSVDSLEVFKSPAYSNLGGGRFDQAYQPYITQWVRSFYDGLESAPAIREHDVLVVCDQPENAHAAGISFTWLTAATPEVPVRRRGIAPVSRKQGEALLQSRPDGIRLYSPMLAQQHEAPAKHLA
jgi:hypothetical protein